MVSRLLKWSHKWHEEKRSGRPTYRNDEIIKLVNEKVKNDLPLTISAMANEFLHAGRTSI